MRLISGLLAGVAFAMLTIMLVEGINSIVFPMPAFDWNDPDAGARLMDAMPLASKLMVVAGWFAGALLGAALAITVARRLWVGYVPPAAVAIGGIANALIIDHPLWMDVAALAAPLIGGAIGIALARRRISAA